MTPPAGTTTALLLVLLLALTLAPVVVSVSASWPSLMSARSSLDMERYHPDLSPTSTLVAICMGTVRWGQMGGESVGCGKE